MTGVFISVVSEKIFQKLQVRPQMKETYEGNYITLSIDYVSVITNGIIIVSNHSIKSTR